MLDFNKIMETFASIPPIYILIALPFTFPRIFIRNTAWQMIQKEQKINISFWQSYKIFLIGYFYGSITPGYVGQLMRIPYMNEQTKEPYGKLFVNSIFETTLHSLSLYAMMFLGALLVIGSFPELMYIMIIWLFIFFIILFYFIKKERGEKLFYLLIKYLIPSSYKKYFYKFIDTFYIDFPRVRKLLLPLFIGMFTWIIIFSQEYLLVMALGLNIPYLYFMLLFPIANAAGFLPITFAGIGTREFAAVIIFQTLFNIPGEQIFVVSFLGFLITDIFTGFIGMIVTFYDLRNNGGRKRILPKLN
jgi:uncharacterized protein (TIRG00374 family)